MSGNNPQTSNQDLVSQILVRARSGIPLEQAIGAVCPLGWFYKQLSKAERAPVLSAYMEHKERAEQVAKTAK